MILAPFAMSALVGGQEIERSFYAWIRTFLLNAFEIVVIALTMVISFKLIGAGISLFDGKNIATSMVDGFWDALNSLFTMILVTAAVKGSNAFLSKASYHNSPNIVYDADTYTGRQRTGKSKKM